MFERFTKRAKQVLAMAQQEAVALGHREITPGHMLIAMRVEREGVAGQVLEGFGVEADSLRAALRDDVAGDAEVLQTLGIDLDEVRRAAEGSFGSDKVSDAFGQASMRTPPPFSASGKQVLEESLKEALRLGHNYIGTEHLLLAIVAQRGDEIGARLLVEHTPGPDAVRADIFARLEAFIGRSGTD